MRVAIIHDYLNQYGGAERVLEALHALYPSAPIYTSLYDPDAMPDAMRTWDIRTSWMQRLPAWRRLFQVYFPIYPSAFESFDLNAYDLILSSSSAYAKGIIPGAHAKHICYCHTPMRFAWQTDAYVAREEIGRVARAFLKIVMTYLRMWDVTTNVRVDQFVANSHEVAARIQRYYGRSSLVIHPPVELPPSYSATPGDYYLTGGRLVPYKRLDLAVRACTAMNLPLKVFGEGRDRLALEAIAGPTVEFLGWVDETQRRQLLAGCCAFLFPGEEDFGITPLEAMAAGRPVIAYAAGGALDTVLDGVTGRFFYEQSPAALATAIASSRLDDFDADAIRLHAEGFRMEVFLNRMRALIAETMNDDMALLVENDVPVG